MLLLGFAAENRNTTVTAIVPSLAPTTPAIGLRNPLPVVRPLIADAFCYGIFSNDLHPGAARFVWGNPLGRVMSPQGVVPEAGRALPPPDRYIDASRGQFIGITEQVETVNFI